MKSSVAMRAAREEVRRLEPCVHGGDAWRYLHLRGEVLDFSANLNPLGPSPRAVEAVERNLWRIGLYPDSNSDALREAIARYLRSVGPGNVVVGNGSVELIYLFAEVFVDKGDEAIIPAPTFGEFENAVRRAGGRPRYVGAGEGLRIDAKHLLEEVGPRTKAIFLCNPNNPTGSLMPREDLLEVVERAEEEQVLVFVDEAFIEFVDDEGSSIVDGVRAHGNLFVLRSLTKAFGLAGLRVGYGVACEEVVDLMLKAKVPWNVNCLAQAAAIAALQDLEHLERTKRLVREEREFMMRELGRMPGLKVFPTHANFVLIDVRRTGLTAAQLKERMLRHGILIRDCSSFKGLDEYYVRVSFRTRRENERLLSALREALSTPVAPSGSMG